MRFQQVRARARVTLKQRIVVHVQAILRGCDVSRQSEESEIMEQCGKLEMVKLVT